jgi:hypothetical protein
MRQNEERAALEAQGISLRDWFAGLAMQGMLANQEFADASAFDIADFAYAQADCMIDSKWSKNEGPQRCQMR